MSTDIFLAVLVLCHTGATPANDTCTTVKYEPSAGRTRADCVGVLSILADKLVADAEGKVFLYGKRCYPLLTLQDAK